MRRLILLIPSLFLALVPFTVRAGSMSDADYIAAMAAMHASDTPAPSPAAVQKPAAPVTGAGVVYATVNGKEVRGYLSRPAGAKGPLPAIIVVHEWWGLNDNIRRMTDRLAGEGYEALAVDLYNAPAANTSNDAKKLAMTVTGDKDAARDNLRQAYAYLHDHEHAGKMGVVGWCFGGGWALQTALLFPDKLDALAMYYGQPVTDVKTLATLKMPLIGFFGEEDTGITVADVLNFQDALKQAGVNAEIHEYPGAGHAFANPSGEHYVPAAAEDSWERMIKFFKEHLR
jgi:carboxymethylenebutenolidase